LFSLRSSSEDETSKKDKYEQKGVDEEKGLRKLIDSEDESETYIKIDHLHISDFDSKIIHFTGVTPLSCKVQ
jgi:hypothetical protein